MLKKVIKSLSEGFVFKLLLLIETVVSVIGVYRLCKFSKFDFVVIAIAFMLVYNVVIFILKSIEPYYKSMKEMQKKKTVSERITYFFEKVLPEKRKDIPKTIYKYVSLNNTSSDYPQEINQWYEEENQKRFDSLTANKIWLSNITKLNDPCEGNHYEYSNWLPFDVGLVDDVIAKERCTKRSESFYNAWNTLRSYFYTSSFSASYDNMPMWAHYCSNHQGYCIEYEVVNPSKLFEVQYWVGRIDLGHDMEQLYSEYFFYNIDELQFRSALSKLQMYIYSMKSSQWKYEQEIRTILQLNCNDKTGMNISCEELGLKIKKILVGINCSDEHETILTAISNELGIEIEKMTFHPIERIVDLPSEIKKRNNNLK